MLSRGAKYALPSAQAATSLDFSLELRGAGMLLYDKTTIKQQTEEENFRDTFFFSFAFCDIILYVDLYFY